MKKIICALILGLILGTQYSFAVEYTEEQKQYLYDVFLEHYTAGMSKNFDTLKLDGETTAQIKQEFENSIDRNELINMSWPCLQPADPTSQEAISKCFMPWGLKQQEKSFEIIKNHIKY